MGEEYPAPALLQRFARAGVPLTTASDAHALPDVADRVDDLRDLLVGAGVTHLQGFRNRRPHQVAVDPDAGPATVGTVGPDTDRTLDPVEGT